MSNSQAQEHPPSQQIQHRNFMACVIQALLTIAAAGAYAVIVFSHSGGRTNVDSQPTLASRLRTPRLPSQVQSAYASLSKKTDDLVVDKTSQRKLLDKSCFTVSTYESIDSDIEIIKKTISDKRTRTHFLGGIVRLAAHDFMDFDQNHRTEKMGSDGCLEATHPDNKGLEKIWCETCELTLLYKNKYSYLSKADFWIASANAVIRQTSIDNALDLKDDFRWGRKDADDKECRGSANRLPSATGCDETEKVLLNRMGLEWKDAVALMGAHTLGRGTTHDGTWVESDDDAQVFDRKYYIQIFNSVWWPRRGSMGTSKQDWVTLRDDGSVEGLMLNTDICLAYDIDDLIDEGTPCCTKINDECIERVSKQTKCPHLSRMSSRWEAREAVQKMLGGRSPHNRNLPFYNAFAKAWGKATSFGQENLVPLRENCDSIFV